MKVIKAAARLTYDVHSLLKVHISSRSKTMLRVWDCFLLEGPKVLFRVSLALLQLHEEAILERSDTISVMKVIKAAARLTYDVHSLLKVHISSRSKTMLRVWDCFLLEGPKVLFRVSLALLQLHEEAILERSDTVSVMKVIKAAARLTYDVHSLLKVHISSRSKTMLRVWDCFLLEGPKVLFRVSLALLQLHEEAILERSDTVSVMKVIKAAARLTYDVHSLLKVHISSRSKTMLRVWDCFLLEGPKVLFRVSLALLQLHEEAILERSDTISVMKVIKAAARLTYDVHSLLKVHISSRSKTMLRVWDCFLLEGPKVLFRVSLALLQLHEEAILERSDTISVMKVIKAAARLTYDVHSLLKVHISSRSKTMFRVWDCFLLEGPKVLFRVSLALLQLHEEAILERSDTISVMKVIKAAARLTYDVHSLLKIAFVGLKPFPRRRELEAKQACYLRLLAERLRKKAELREAYTGGGGTVSKPSSPGTPLVAPMPLECLGSCGERSSLGVLAFGRQEAGKLAMVDARLGTLWQLHLLLDSRVVSLALGDEGVVFLGLISQLLVAVSLPESGNPSGKLWEVKLGDVALSMAYSEGRIFAALANGSLAVIENGAEKAPSFLELYYIPLGPAPLATLALVGDQYLWVGMGSKAVAMNRRTLDMLETVHVASSTSGGCVSFFERLIGFFPCPAGVWLATHHSSFVQLWDPHTYTCKLIFDISSEHHCRRERSDGSAAATEKEAQITSLLAHDTSLWVGTADGYLFLYDLRRKHGAIPTGLPTVPSTSCLQRGMPQTSSGRFSTSPREESKRPVEAKRDSEGMRDSGYSEAGSGRTSIDEPTNQAPSPTPSPSPSHTSLSASAAKVARKKRDMERAKGSPSGRSRHVSTGTDSRSGSRTGSRKHSPASSLSRHPSASHLLVRPKSLISLSRQNSNDSGNTSPTGRKGSFLDRLRSVTSSGSLQSNNLDSLEFDDMFYLYREGDGEEPGEGVRVGRSGGLCSAQLHRSESLWSLGQEPLLPPMVEELLGGGKKRGESESEVPTIPSSLKLRRKDLQFDEAGPPVAASPVLLDTDDLESVSDRRNSFFASSETASVISVGSSIEAPFPYILALQMKLKISDKPVKCLSLFSAGGDDQVVLSCAGHYGEDEAVLKWTKEPNSGLWINDPIVEQRQEGHRPDNRSTTI